MQTWRLRFASLNVTAYWCRDTESEPFGSDGKAFAGRVSGGS